MAASGAKRQVKQVFLCKHGIFFPALLQRINGNTGFGFQAIYRKKYTTK